MTREYAASFGAWHALKPRFPRASELSPPPGRERVRELMNGLALRSCADDIPALEQELLLRYSHALLLVGRFLPDEAGPLLRWLREEFDWYNFILLAKKLRAQTDDARIQSLLFRAPLPVKEPPSPSEVRSDDELIAAFAHIIGKKERSEVKRAAASTFENLESACLRVRLAHLEAIAEGLDPESKLAVGSYIRAGKSGTSAAPRGRGFCGECAATRFLELAAARDGIRRLCEAAGNAV